MLLLSCCPAVSSLADFVVFSLDYPFFSIIFINSIICSPKKLIREQVQFGGYLIERFNIMQKSIFSVFIGGLFIIFIFAGLLGSCSKSPKCWGDNKNEGIINGFLRIDYSPTVQQEHYVITSDSVYQQTFGVVAAGGELPYIDFSKQTLLGARATGQCKVKVIREVSSISKENKYHYKIKVKSCGLCKKMAYIDNWVTVPKLPNGWTVTFEIQEK